MTGDECKCEKCQQPEPKEVTMKELDFTRPVQTADGRDVVILSTEGPNRPVVGYIKTQKNIMTWHKNGDYYSSMPSLRLVQAKTKTKKTIGIYRTRSGNVTSHIDGDLSRPVGKHWVKLAETTVEWEE